MEYNKKRITIDKLSSHSFLQTQRELIFNLNKYSKKTYFIATKIKFSFPIIIKVKL